MRYVRKHAESDIAENKVKTGKDYSPAVGWLLEKIAMTSMDHDGLVGIFFHDVPRLTERIKRFGNGDEVYFGETMKSARAMSLYCGRKSIQEVQELKKEIDRYGRSLQTIDGQLYSHLDPIEPGAF